ncbi:MAG: hypothetical protein ACHWZW_10220 [Spirulina sp.]
MLTCLKQFPLRWLCLGFALALWPHPAQANSGSAMLWVGFWPLMLGNLGIGYLESGILARVFHTPRRLSFGVMVFANLASAWVGLALLPGWLSNHPRVALSTAWGWLLGALGLALVITLVMEYPFVWALFRQKPQAAKTALKANLLIHSISYLVLVGWYALSSQTTLLTQFSLVPAQQLQPSAAYVLYFKTLEGQPMQINLDGTGAEHVAPEVFADLEPQRVDRFGPVPQLLPPQGISKAETGNWQYFLNRSKPGLTGQKTSQNERFHLALETPMLSWQIRYVTHLTGDLAIFQLGGHQIALLQPQTRQIAILAQGQDPIVVLR